jgi:predicted transcriptional regulator
MKTPYVPKKKLMSLLEKIEGRNLKTRTRKALIISLLKSPEHYTQEDIAESLGVSRTYVGQVLYENFRLAKVDPEFEAHKDILILNQQIEATLQDLKALCADPLLWGKEKRECRKLLAELIEKKQKLTQGDRPTVVVNNHNVNTVAQSNGDAGGLTGEDREFQERMLETLQRRFSTK